MPRASRTAQNAVHVEVIEGKLRAMRNEIVRKIDRRLSRLGMYEEVSLNYFFTDLVCWQRHKAIKDLQPGLTCGTIEHWSWMPGGGRAGVVVHVVWKVPTLVADRDLQKTMDLQNECVARQKQYYNKATRVALLAVVSPLYISSKSVLLATVTYFTSEFNINVSLPSDRTVNNQEPQIAARLSLLTQDEDIALDLRRLNGGPSNPGFDLFSAKVEFLLEEFKKVDDRRHGAFHSLVCFLDDIASYIPFVYFLEFLDEKPLHTLVLMNLQE